MQLYGNLLKPLTEIFIYASATAKVIGGSQLALFLGYFVGTSWWLKTIMPPFGRLTAQKQELEGEFRNQHTRVLGHAEEIAFLDGGQREKDQADRAFTAISEKNDDILRQRARMAFLDTTVVKHFGTLVSYWAMIPSM